MKSPHKSGQFDTSGSTVELFVPKIMLSEFFVTEEQQQEKLPILGFGYERKYDGNIHESEMVT